MSAQMIPSQTQPARRWPVIVLAAGVVVATIAALAFATTPARPTTRQSADIRPVSAEQWAAFKEAQAAAREGAMVRLALPNATTPAELLLLKEAQAAAREGAMVRPALPDATTPAELLLLKEAQVDTPQ